MTQEIALIITKLIVWGTPVVWILWDTFAYLRFGVSATESHYIYTTYQKRHWFALILGIAAVVLLWHFFAQ